MTEQPAENAPEDVNRLIPSRHTSQNYTRGAFSAGEMSFFGIVSAQLQRAVPRGRVDKESPIGAKLPGAVLGVPDFKKSVK